MQRSIFYFSDTPCQSKLVAAHHQHYRDNYEGSFSFSYKLWADRSPNLATFQVTDRSGMQIFM